MPQQEPIDVSIIIPVYNRWDLTSKCLSSLQKFADGHETRAEIIIGDDGSTDETPIAWRDFPKFSWPVTYHRNAKNLGFLRNCMETRKKASGRFYCFLNNDTEVTGRWLDTLIKTFESFPEAGVVGPVFLNPDGSVLECGSIIYSDGSIRQQNWGGSPTNPAFSFARNTDYVSFACALVPRDLFEDLGGFDDRYAPCYYEDSDFCMRVWDSGKRVIVNPLAKIIHSEGGTSGTDLSAGPKQNQESNRDIFLEKWQGTLASTHPPPHTQSPLRRTKNTIFIHYPRAPEYDQDSGALRIWLLANGLRERGNHVVFVTPARHGNYLTQLRLHGIEVAHADPQSLRALILEHTPTAAIFSHFESERDFGMLYATHSPGTTRILDTVDLAFVRETREKWLAEGKNDTRDVRPSDLTVRGWAELTSMLRSDLVYVVSDYEAAVLRHGFFLPDERVHIVSNIHEAVSSPRSLGQREGFVFLGGFRHPPNVDAIHWIVDEIWPIIRKEIPDAVLSICGSAAPTTVRDLHAPDDGIHFEGFVQDHRMALGKARVMLCPLRYGAGVKGKIGEAVAVGTPVVTTAVGAEGIDADAQVLCVAESVEDLAAASIALHNDPTVWEEKSAAGLSLLDQRFSAEANTARVEESILKFDRKMADNPWALASRCVLHAEGTDADHGSYRMVASELWGELRRTQAALTAADKRLNQALAREVANQSHMKTLASAVQILRQRVGQADAMSKSADDAAEHPSLLRSIRKFF